MIGFCNPARIMLLGKQTCEFLSRIITEKEKPQNSPVPPLRRLTPRLLAKHDRSLKPQPGRFFAGIVSLPVLVDGVGHLDQPRPVLDQFQQF